jgi:hypothetical protein
MRPFVFVLVLILTGCALPIEHDEHVMPQGNLEDYQLTLMIEPAVLKPNEQAKFQITLAHSNGSLVRLERKHERLMHVMLIRNDLQYFAHIHAQNDATGASGGTFTLFHSFPAPGKYRAMVEFMEGGKELSKPLDIVVLGNYTPVSLGSDFSRVGVFDGYTVTLNGPDTLTPGVMAMFTADVRQNGVFVNDKLENYLGEKMHLAVWQEGLKHFAHVHSVMMGGQMMFHVSFPTAGRYKLYPQFMHDGKVISGEFVVNVT